MLGVSTRTLDRYVRKRVLKAHRRGRRTMFVKDDIEAINEVPTANSHVVNEEQNLPAEPQPDISALANLAQEMHREIQMKDHEISQLNFQLGKYQEIAKNSVPLLEAEKKDRNEQKKVDGLNHRINTLKRSRFVFLVLFAISLAIIGILANSLFVQ
jgi:hypothetical protein